MLLLRGINTRPTVVARSTRNGRGTPLVVEAKYTSNPANAVPPRIPGSSQSPPRNEYGYNPGGASSNTGFTSNTTGAAATSIPSQADINKIIAQLTELLQETIQIVMSTGPRGVFRAVQGATAIAELARDYVASGGSDPPHVIMRKLFEKLGATYIKLGQFIASTPSLFPDEYVMEFQKCLDKTDPVPFSTIKQTLEKELKRPASDVFASIDPKPLASASVAQASCTTPWHGSAHGFDASIVPCGAALEHACTYSTWPHGALIRHHVLPCCNLNGLPVDCKHFGACCTGSAQQCLHFI